MVPSDSASALRRLLASRGIDIETATLDQIVGAALDFYGTAPMSGLATTTDADMMLLQFGVYDWGNGQHFEFDITRQFITAGEEGDDAISQLHCTTDYEPTAALRSIGSGSRWCKSRADLPEFKTAILASDAYMAALPLSIKRRRIEWEPV